MAVERKNPLPAGRYWVDQFDRVGPSAQNGILHFDGWLQRNSPRFVRLVRRESFNSLFNGKQRVWYLFDVVEPVAWEKGWGFPTIVQAGATPSAPMAVQTSEDTVQTPPPESPLQPFTDLLADVKTGAVVVALVWLYLQNKRGW